MRFATVRAEGRQLCGSVTDAGFTALNRAFPVWADLRQVIAADGLAQLAKAARAAAVTHVSGFVYDTPVPNPEKIICVGVNIPARNAEYRDGTEAPQNMSLFPQFADPSWATMCR